MIEAVTGERPDTCPWRAFQEPLVSDVLCAYGLHEQAAAQALWLGPDPPNVLIEALRFYTSSVSRVRGDLDERERKKRDAKRGR